MSYFDQTDSRPTAPARMVGPQPGLLQLAADSPVDVLRPASLCHLASRVAGDRRQDPKLVEALSASVSDTLLEQIDAFKPHIFLSTSPFGIADELRTPLRVLRSSGCRSVLTLRDIYAPPRADARFSELTDDEYQLVMIGVPEELNSWVPPQLQGSHLSDAIQHIGYLRPLDEPEADRIADDGPLVICHVGGGGDGSGLLVATADAVQTLRESGFPDLSVLPVTGPMMGASEANRLGRNIPDWIRVTGWLSHPHVYARRRLAKTVVVSMAGYNSSVEAAWYGTPTILCPREDKQEWEQQIRAKILAETFSNITTSASISADALASLISEHLTTEPNPVRPHRGWFANPGAVASIAAEPTPPALRRNIP